MKEFDFYEVTGVIAPGMILTVGAVLLFFHDQSQNLSSIANLSLGSLGVGVILAYVAGQLLQAIGNGLETLWWWFWSGMPTDWIRSGKHELIAPTQRDNVQARLRITLHTPTYNLCSSDAKGWYAITRQVYAAVSAAGRSSRIDIFNGNYGLCRGIASGFLVLLVWSAIVNLGAWKVEMILAFLIGLAIYRMHRFAVRYGRELFVQYLQLPEREAERVLA
jgi:hypothetical protein